MKRDARIGMAVVLVLGLSVTLLAGRALYKRGGGTGDLECEVVDASRSSERPGDAVSNQTRPIGRGEFEPLLETPGLHQQLATSQTPLPPQTGVTETSREPDHEGAPPSIAELGTIGRTETPRGTTQVKPASEIYAYTVASGDNPWKISSKVFGDGKYTQKIVDANGGMDVLKTKMKSGSVIKIPQIQNKQMLVNLPSFCDSKGAKTAPVKAERAPASAPTATKVTTYKVARGDTLSGIALKNYGSSGSKMVNLIVGANPGLDAKSLKVGQEIVVPAAK